MQLDTLDCPSLHHQMGFLLSLTSLKGRTTTSSCIVVCWYNDVFRTIFGIRQETAYSIEKLSAQMALLVQLL